MGCSDGEFWEAACMTSLQAQGRKRPEFDKILEYLPGAFKDAKAASNRWDRLLRDLRNKSTAPQTPKKKAPSSPKNKKSKGGSDMLMGAVEFKQDTDTPGESIQVSQCKSSEDEAPPEPYGLASPSKRLLDDIATPGVSATPKRKCKNVQSYFQDEEEILSDVE